MNALYPSLADIPVFWLGLTGSLLAGLATGIGALPVFMVRTLSARIQDILLGFSAGIMLAATFFSLILPGLAIAETATGSEINAVLLITAGMLSGAVTLWLVHRYVPHEHFIMGKQGPDIGHLKRIWLFIIAITLHNFPEGMSVGVGFGGDDVGNGISLMMGIGLQNMPEGLAVAVALVSVGYPRTTAFGVAVLTGLVEPVGGLFGALTVVLASALLPLGLAFAGGAMLFVISDEIIPETHRRGFEDYATFSLMIGFVVMMFLDVTLG